MAKVDKYWELDPNRNNMGKFDRQKHFEIATKAYWEDIDDCWKRVITAEEHLEILQECKRYNAWEVYSVSKVAPKRLAKFGNKAFPNRWVAFPNEKTFPVFMNFYNKHKEEFDWHEPEIRKLDAGGMILPHTHDSEKETKYLYNMSINHPEGCLFGIKPYGKVPYNAGDVMKINVHNEHCVWNNTNTDRYHAILGYIKGSR